MSSWHHSRVFTQFCQASCFRVIGSMLNSVNSMNTSPFPYFICCKISLLVRSNVVWNSMMINKAFHKSKDDGFGRIFTDREGKSISREVSIPVKIKQHVGRVQRNHPASRWLARLPGEWCHIRFCLLAGWTFSSGCGQISLVLLSPCKTTIVVAMATFCVYLVKTAVAGDRVSLTATE